MPNPAVLSGVELSWVGHLVDYFMREGLEGYVKMKPTSTLDMILPHTLVDRFFFYQFL